MKPHLPHFIRGTKKKSTDKDVKRSGVNPQRAGLATATVVILSFLLCMPMLPSKVTLKPGDVSPEDIFARKTVRYVETVETELRRDRAAATVPDLYDPVLNATDEAISTLKRIFGAAEEVRTGGNGRPLARKIAQVRERLGSTLGSRISDATISGLLAADPQTMRDIEGNALRLVISAMQKDLPDKPVQMSAARKQVSADAVKMLGSTSVAKVVGEVAGESIRPNRIFNEAKTATAQNKAREEVRPVSKWIHRGDLVIGRGSEVLPEHIEQFEALGLRHPTLDYKSTLSLTLLVIVAVCIVVAYLWRYHNEVYSNLRAMYLLSIIVVFSTLALRVGGSMLGINLQPAQVGYLGLLWVVTASMFMAVLLSPHVSVVITALLSIVLSLLLDNELRFAASALIISLAGIYSVANIRDRSDFVRTMGFLALTSVAMVWIMGSLNADPLHQMVVGTVWSLLIAWFATMIFWFGIAPLERPFGRTTHMSLLELADTNRPLLRRLLMEAPGTYTHSMTVGYLAETAAEAIGADSLVARVASYYHDIGKIRRPHFFIENQNVENVHDRINPTLSALVITSHIKDGIDIAKEFRIPKVVLNIIGEHHGTSLVQYFYHQMTGEQEPSTALEQQFRYPGPKPQTKEAAVVMLADAVEAASRGISKPTPAKIEMMVNRIVADKLRDGQLDECELTFKDLSRITGCFVKTLTSIMHARIEYPDAPTAEDRRITTDADINTEQPKDTGEAAQDTEHSPTAPTG